MQVDSAVYSYSSLVSDRQSDVIIRNGPELQSDHTKAVCTVCLLICADHQSTDHTWITCRRASILPQLRNMQSVDSSTVSARARVGAPRSFAVQLTNRDVITFAVVRRFDVIPTLSVCFLFRR